MVRKFGKNFAALALAVGVISTSQVCHFFLNQPEVPDEMKKLVDKRKKQRAKGCQRKGGDRMYSDMIYRVMIEKSVLFIWQRNTEKNANVMLHNQYSTKMLKVVKNYIYRKKGQGE